MADDPSVITQFETQSTIQDRRTDLVIRTLLSDTYVFVRSSQINKTIASFTFDHYIDEAKREIVEDRILTTASNPTQGSGKRQAKLTALTTLETNFNNTLESIKKLAAAKDSSSRRVV